MAEATAKTKTTTVVEGITLTLTIAEAEAVWALVGRVNGGYEHTTRFVSPEREASDGVYRALSPVMQEVTDHDYASQTIFSRSLTTDTRISLSRWAKWERELLG